MPTYEYQCPEGHHFELFQKMSDDPISECPTCGARAERLISGGAGFLFKGEGFYITDTRSDEYRKKASAERESTSGGSSGDSGTDGGKTGSNGGSGSTGGGSQGSTGSSGSAPSSSSDG